MCARTELVNVGEMSYIMLLQFELNSSTLWLIFPTLLLLGA